VSFLGGIQRRDLPGQVVISSPAVSLWMLIVTPTRRGYMPSRRSGRPGLLPVVHGVSVSHIGILNFVRGTRNCSPLESVAAARRASASGGAG
jgi:hypothetical protein